MSQIDKTTCVYFWGTSCKYTRFVCDIPAMSSYFLRNFRLFPTPFRGMLCIWWVYNGNRVDVVISLYVVLIQLSQPKLKLPCQGVPQSWRVRWEGGPAVAVQQWEEGIRVAGLTGGMQYCNSDFLISLTDL